MTNNTATSVVFHDGNEFALCTNFLVMQQVPCCLVCPLILVEHPSSLLAINTGGKLPTKPNSATLPIHQLSAAVSHFVSTRSASYHAP